MSLNECVGSLEDDLYVVNLDKLVEGVARRALP